MEKFTKTNAEKYIKTSSDAQVAQLGHLNKIVEVLPPYTTYLAEVFQTGTAVPRLRVLMNNTGLTPTMTRQNIGLYKLLLNSTVLNTQLVVSGSTNFSPGTNGVATNYYGVGSGSTFTGYYGMYPDSILGDLNVYDSIQIQVFDDIWDSEEMSNIFGPSRLYIEFRIFT